MPKGTKILCLQIVAKVGHLPLEGLISPSYNAKSPEGSCLNTILTSLLPPPPLLGPCPATFLVCFASFH